MGDRVSKSSRLFLFLFGCVLLPSLSWAQRPPVNPPTGGGGAAARGGSAGINPAGRLVVYVRDSNGAPLSQMALVTVTQMTNQYYGQATSQAGQATFENVFSGRYTVQVIAPGYERASQEIEVLGMEGLSIATVMMQPETDPRTAAPSPGPPILSGKAQKELGKALEELRAGKPGSAKTHLDAAYHLAPGNPDVNFLIGAYFAQINDWTQAKRSWERTVGIYPQHVRALLSLGEALLRENNSAGAADYFKRAIEAEPTAWRAHAFLADAQFRQRSFAEAVRQAERALELGHQQAASVQPLLALALAAQGDSERAAKLLEAYLKDHASDSAAQALLASWRTPRVATASESSGSAAPADPPAPAAAAALPLPSSWIPPDVDEKIPPVEPGIVCALDHVLNKAGMRVKELVGNVDRFTATESLVHETFNAWGLPSAAVTRKFDYLVSIEEIRPGLLSVDEYRDGGFALEKFPEGIATRGLPSLVLIFHPYNSGNYEMTCEGLARWSGGLAWQIHFRQRPDKPNTLRSYKVGAMGPSYPVALKGRAWIAADTFQIVRLESDLVAPLPAIRLVADHAVVEYGPVHFQNKKVSMWLPQTAELYFDWRGRRMHRRHSFSNYLLFSVDDKQRIAAPKVEEGAAEPSAVAPPNP